MNATDFPKMLAGWFAWWEIIPALVVILLLVNIGRLQELAIGLRRGIVEFRKATDDVSKEIRNWLDLD